MKKLLLLTFILLVATNSHAYYQAEQGRWLNRDPIRERGGENLYGGMENNTLSKVDSDGRVVIDSHEDAVNMYQSAAGGVHQIGPNTLADITDESAYSKFLKDAPISDAKKSATCSSSGTFTLNENSPLFQTHNLVIGRVVLNAAGECSWSCGSVYHMKKQNKCVCSCTVTCSSLAISFSEDYDFTPHDSDGFLKRNRDRFYGWVAADYGRDKTVQSYTLTGAWTASGGGGFSVVNK